MGHWQHELTSKSNVGAETLSEIFRRVPWVVDVPLELISDDDTSNADVQFNYSDGLAL